MLQNMIMLEAICKSGDKIFLLCLVCVTKGLVKVGESR